MYSHSLELLHEAAHRQSHPGACVGTAILTTAPMPAFPKTTNHASIASCILLLMQLPCHVCGPPLLALQPLLSRPLLVSLPVLAPLLQWPSSQQPFWHMFSTGTGVPCCRELWWVLMLLSSLLGCCGCTLMPRPMPVLVLEMLKTVAALIWTAATIVQWLDGAELMCLMAE